MKEDKKKIYIRTFGCQMNNRDSEVTVGLLEKAGYKLADGEKGADVVIFNTCSVRQHAEDKVWSEVGRLASKSVSRLAGKQANRQTGKPIIGIAGCMAQNYKEEIFKKAPAVDFVVGPSDIAKIPQILKELTGRGMFEKKIWETDGNARPDEIYHCGFYEDKGHAYVVISEGCVNYCSYCVVPYVRGKLRNRDYKDIIREVEGAVARGITRVTLLGQNVNAYDNFAGLLKRVNSIKGLKEVSFVTSHPKDASEELFKTMAECDKVKKSLHLPLQSGSDRILKLMNRGYTSKGYMDLIEKYRKIVPDSKVSTDIIVGFPTESEKDFLDTYELMKKARFDSAYIFKYSPRPKTEAAKLTDDVPEAEKKRRHRVLLDYQKELNHRKQCLMTNDKAQMSK
jgi:tRNA-2-methylthio-N6-dimethylallyladenosine synthase